jgi:hypothetical protein
MRVTFVSFQRFVFVFLRLQQLRTENNFQSTVHKLKYNK